MPQTRIDAPQGKRNRTGLSREGLVCFEDLLRKGCVEQLLCRGGARLDMSLDEKGNARRGRLWERHDVLKPLEFTVDSFDAIVQATANMASIAKPIRGSGDEVVCYLLAQADKPIMHSTLVWLSARWGKMWQSGDYTPNFTKFLDAGGDVLIEALAPELAQGWADAEQAKASMDDPKLLSQYGKVQDAGLQKFLGVIDARGRRDLATFLVDASKIVMTSKSAKEIADGYLLELTTGRIVDRQNAKQAAGAFLRAVGQIGRWHDEHRYTRSFEPEYPRCQALTARWEGLRGAVAIEAATALEAL